MNALWRPPRALSFACATALLSSLAGSARAQLADLEDGVSVGAWTFYPTLALRVRGEYRHGPIDVGGDVYERTAIQSDAADSAAPVVVRRDPSVSEQWLVAERTRLGVRVERDVLAAAVVLQDARVLGRLPGAPQLEAGGSGTLEPHLAYLEASTALEDPTLRVRVGRQRLRWGEGRLVGDSEWSPRGGALDAADVLFMLGAVDMELMAALLAPPGALPPPHISHAAQLATTVDGAPDNAAGTGGQLYGLRLGWAIVEPFNAELVGLARFSREPLPAEMMRGDTYVVDGRIHGEHRGLGYSAEGACELGRVASYGFNRDVASFAAAGGVWWQTGLPWDFRFAVEGGYASGDDSNGEGDALRRFDPIVPDVHVHDGMMDVTAWSNAITGSGEVSARPVEELTAEVGYTFVGLAQPGDRWTTAALVAVGSAADNGSHVLGHEIDGRLRVEPWSELAFTAGYGLLVLGEGGKAVLAAAGRGERDLLHYGLVEAELVVP